MNILILKTYFIYIGLTLIIQSSIFNCREMKFKFLNYFLGRMGEPPISELKEWKFPSPGMVTHYYLKLVCEFEKK